MACAIGIVFCTLLPWWVYSPSSSFDLIFSNNTVEVYSETAGVIARGLTFWPGIGILLAAVSTGFFSWRRSTQGVLLSVSIVGLLSIAAFLYNTPMEGAATFGSSISAAAFEAHATAEMSASWNLGYGFWSILSSISATALETHATAEISASWNLGYGFWCMLMLCAMTSTNDPFAP